MPTTTFDPSTNEVSVEQKTAEAAALEKGQELADANAEDKLRQFEKTESENELIGGKFRTQEDLLKAYQELQTKLGSNEKTEEREEATAEADETPTDETPEEEEPADDTVDYMFELNKEFEEKGQLSEEAIDKLSAMDTKDLIASYMKYQAKSSEQARAGLQNQ